MKAKKMKHLILTEKVKKHFWGIANWISDFYISIWEFFCFRVLASTEVLVSTGTSFNDGGKISMQTIRNIFQLMVWDMFTLWRNFKKFGVFEDIRKFLDFFRHTNRLNFLPGCSLPSLHNWFIQLSRVFFKLKKTSSRRNFMGWCFCWLNFQP